MLPAENIRKIVVGPTGRITALSGVNSRPLQIGDRISFMSSDKNFQTENGSVDSIEIYFKKKPTARKILRIVEAPPIAISRLMEHASETFGSKEAAEEWLSIECGALDNESPVNFIHKTGNTAEVERILNCIDYGMFA